MHWSQVRKPIGSEVKWDECSLIIGTGCRVFAWSSRSQSVCKWVFCLLAIWCLRIPSFESCIQQRKTTCLISIRKSDRCRLAVDPTRNVGSISNRRRSESLCYLGWVIGSRLSLKLPRCRIYVSVNWVIIGSGNGLAPVRPRYITRSNAHLMSIGSLGTNFSEIWIEIQNFHNNKNAFENVVWEMAVIFSRRRWVNEPYRTHLLAGLGSG